jgi:hypothetical protein
LIRGGTVARCPVCRQAVALKGQALVPHYGADKRKICPGSGKPVAADAAAPPPAGKDLSTFMTRDVIKLISCKRTADPRIEILTLDYLDKSERVRIQIEALREMLGSAFRIKDFPPSLHKPHLAVWGNADTCVAAKKHDHGGFESIADADIASVLADLRQHRDTFFTSRDR